VLLKEVLRKFGRVDSTLYARRKKSQNVRI